MNDTHRAAKAIAQEYSCAGSTRALEWTHADPNSYTHQWCRLKMDGRQGYTDGQAGMAGYVSYFPTASYIGTGI